MPNIEPKQAKPDVKPKPTGLEAFLGSNPFLSLSIWAHIAVIFYVFQHPDFLTPDIPETPVHDVAREYTRASRQQAMRERVDDMEAVKKVMENLSRKSDAETETTLQQPSASDIGSTTSLPTESSTESMQELLARSEQLLQDIRALGDDALQEKLAALADDAEASKAEPSPEKNTEKDPETDLEKNPDNDLENDDVKETLEERVEQLSDEELVQAVSKNQLEARAMLGKIMRSEAAKQQGNNSNSPAPDGSEGSGSSGATGQGFDPNNPLSVEHHFGEISQGSLKDVSQAMRSLSAGSLNTLGDAEEDEIKPLQAPPIHHRQTLVFSRKLTGTGEKANWVVLNAWYFIGPFPNPGRANIHTRFPPEISIDLNAVYIGDSNRLLTWQYIQFDHLPVIPPDFTDYAVYYAYTEVFSEKAQDVWLAIGSDDQSKLWVNDMLVWQSSDHERVWSLAQGYRKVYLEQGQNKFLFRLENGIERAAFSVSLAPANE